MTRASDFGRRLRTFWDTQVWLRERQQLRMRPWEQDLLHWSLSSEGWVLHGHLPPPPGRRRSVTRDGWCACLPGGSQATTLVRASHTKPNKGSASGT